jgi:hypothetical protein
MIAMMMSLRKSFFVPLAENNYYCSLAQNITCLVGMFLFFYDEISGHIIFIFIRPSIYRPRPFIDLGTYA